MNQTKQKAGIVFFLSSLAIITTVGQIFAQQSADIQRVNGGQDVNATTTPATSTIPSYILDHFKCYISEGASVNDLAFLRDQFGIADKKYEKDIVSTPKLFCNPVRKIHETAGAINSVGISNVDNHLTWYSIKSAIGEQFKPRQVLVTNQFVPNGQKLNVIRPEFLVVPTQKISVDGKPTDHGAPKDLDHFKCYRVEGAQINPQNAKLMDQFNLPNTWDSVKVIRAQYLCNPTAKAHFIGFNDATGAAQFTTSTIQHYNDHLVCYVIQPNTNANHKLLINNQFGLQQQLYTSQSKLLCVPSTKRVLSTNIDTSINSDNNNSFDN